MDSFVEWCATNHLHINITKTKELVEICPHTYLHQQCDWMLSRITNTLKYTWITNRAKNTEAVYKKGQSRLYFLRRLLSFNIMLKMFYQSVVASTIFFAVVCWDSRLWAADTNKISRIEGWLCPRGPAGLLGGGV